MLLSLYLYFIHAGSPADAVSKPGNTLSSEWKVKGVHVPFPVKVPASSGFLLPSLLLPSRTWHAEHPPRLIGGQFQIQAKIPIQNVERSLFRPFEECRYYTEGTEGTPKCWTAGFHEAGLHDLYTPRPLCQDGLGGNYLKGCPQPSASRPVRVRYLLRH